VDHRELTTAAIRRPETDGQTAYSVTFAAFLLLWGRVSDLYSAKPVFAYGFLGKSWS
jgi:MFS family permease